MDTAFTLYHIRSILVLLLWYPSNEKSRVALHEKERKALAEHPGGHIFHLTNLPCLGHRQLGHLLICYSVPAAKGVCCQGDESQSGLPAVLSCFRYFPVEGFLQGKTICGGSTIAL